MQANFSGEETVGEITQNAGKKAPYFCLYAHTLAFNRQHFPQRYLGCMNPKPSID